MPLTFANFKKLLPTQILSRGRDYLRQGHVLDLTFNEEEVLWEAQVEGTAVYDVSVEQTAAGGLHCTCTCPYDLGEHCKHVAALLYAIEDAFPDQLGTTPRRKAAQRETRHDKLRQRLESVSREQLVTILLELAQADRELLNQLLIRLDSGEAKPMDYRRVVRDALRTGRDDHGYLDYTGANRAGRRITELLNQADRWREAGEVERASGFYQAVIEELVPVLHEADDSNGTLGGCLSVAVEGLTASVTLLDEAGREALFTFCLEQVRRKGVFDWDWGWELLAIPVDMVDNPARRARVMSALEDIEGSADNSYSDYLLEQTATFKLELIERFDRSDAAREFLRAHLHLDRLRMILIERCINEGALEEAMRLIQEGIDSSQHRQRHGLTNEYRTLRVRLLQKNGDQRGLINAARGLWLNRSDEESFALLKQTVPRADWPPLVEGLIEELGQNSRQLAWLYAREGRWDDLLAVVQASPNAIDFIETYREPLEARFADPMAALYERIIDVIMARASDRGDYRQVVIYLRRIRKIDSSERAEAIVTRLKTEYARRYALLDELSRL